MPFNMMSLSEIARFKNGKSIKLGLIGSFPVYGANGVIGGSDDYMYDSSVIVGRVGAYCGAVELCKSKFWASDNTIVVQANEDKITLDFLYYLLKDANLNRYAGGAAQPLLTQSRLKLIEFPVPPLAVQHRIAAILSAYDDLIENNMRRIDILEEMTRRLYEEWFVQFRFPGHEGAVFEKKTISQVADVIRGRSYRSIDLVADGRPFVNLKCINRDGGYRRDGLKHYCGKFKPEQLVKSGDIVMAVTDMTQERRIVARAALIPDLGEFEGVISMDLVRILPKDGIPSLYLYSFFRWSDFSDNVKNHATGANVLHLHPDLVAGYEINLPPSGLCAEFAKSVRPAINLIEVLEKKNINLRAQRDLLLPKLISGEIDVSEVPMPN